MSLYNTLFGISPSIVPLLKILEIDPEKTGRIRDAYVDKEPDGKYKVILFTRNGGNNRKCWNFEGCKNGKHDERCLIPIIEGLKTHPCYIKDYDDISDDSYAYFEFSVPKKHFEHVEHIYINTPDKRKPMEKFDDLLKKVKNGDMSDPEVSRAISIGKDIIDRVTGAFEKHRKKGKKK